MGNKETIAVYIVILVLLLSLSCMAEKHIVLNTGVAAMQIDKAIQNGTPTDKAKTGNYLDSLYMNMMNNHHNKTISLFEMENKRETNSALNMVAEEESSLLKMYSDSSGAVYGSLTK